MRRCASLLLLTAAVLALVTPAWAHDEQSSFGTAVAPPIESARVVPPAASSSRGGQIVGVSAQGSLASVILALGFALLLGAAAGLRRRSLISVLVVVLVAFSFEVGVHSGHHVGSPHEAHRCALASASTHLGGAAVEPVRLDVPPSSGALAERPPSWLVSPRPLLPDHQRAPPLAG
jgi:hypothetical protein